MKNNDEYCDELLKQLDEIAEKWLIQERKEFNEMYYKTTKQGIKENRIRKFERVFGNK